MFFQQIEENLRWVLLIMLRNQGCQQCFFCAADKIDKSIIRLIKEKKVTNMSLFYIAHASRKLILHKAYKILPVAYVPDVRVDGDLPVVNLNYLYIKILELFAEHEFF